MIESVIPVIAIISTFGSLIFFVYMHYTSRHRERMALIQQGIDPMAYKARVKENSSSRILKNGILFAAVGMGLVAGWALEEGGFPSEVAYFSMIFLFGGFGMVIYYYSQRPRSRNAEMLSEEV